MFCMIRSGRAGSLERSTIAPSGRTGDAPGAAPGQSGIQPSGSCWPDWASAAGALAAAAAVAVTMPAKAVRRSINGPSRQA
jgi:hypothetical protein